MVYYLNINPQLNNYDGLEWYNPDTTREHPKFDWVIKHEKWTGDPPRYPAGTGWDKWTVDGRLIIRAEFYDADVWQVLFASVNPTYTLTGWGISDYPGARLSAAVRYLGQGAGLTFLYWKGLVETWWKLPNTSIGPRDLVIGYHWVGSLAYETTVNVDRSPGLIEVFMYGPDYYQTHVNWRSVSGSLKDWLEYAARKVQAEKGVTFDFNLAKFDHMDWGLELPQWTRGWIEGELSNLYIDLEPPIGGFSSGRLEMGRMTMTTLVI